MADLNFSRTTQQMRGSGFAGLFGLFAGLCAIFAGCVTLSDWYDAASRARWPVVSAVVERAEIDATSRTSKDGGATVWKLAARVRYELNGEPLMVTVTSHTVFSEAEAAKLQSWAAQHRKGSHIDVSYDPSRPNQAVFASAELSGDAARMRNDLTLLAIAAIASVCLLALAKYLGAREARAAPVTDNTSRGGPVVGLACAAMGLLLVGLTLHAAVHADPVTADHFMGVPAGLMFVFAGILMALPPKARKWQSLLATLLITCFALTFDWVAFGSGERRFAGSVMGLGFIPGEYLGRTLFGLFAVILDFFAVKMWIDQCRRGFGGSAGSASSNGSPTTNPADSTA